ncbi:hypothetical protein PMIN06_004988 [Paraphaeosphaeria minitans]
MATGAKSPSREQKRARRCCCSSSGLHLSHSPTGPRPPQTTGPVRAAHGTRIAAGQGRPDTPGWVTVRVLLEAASKRPVPASSRRENDAFPTALCDAQGPWPADTSISYTPT